MLGVRSIASLVALAFVSACGTAVGPVVREGSISLSPSVAFTFEKLAFGAAGAGLLYLVYDPLAPNWNIEERALNGDTYYLSLRAKSFRTGGDGEAMRIIQRRALQLQREMGYTGYRLLDYSEGIESSTPLTHRYSEGTIQLVRTDGVAGP